MISVQEDDFDTFREYRRLIKSGKAGAVVTFVGRVRDFDSITKSFYLQHYAGMTETVLRDIETQANTRWNLLDSIIIHRVGHLSIDDQIVFVGVSSQHRNQAFQACEFIIDILKTQAPFWKKEGAKWVEAKVEDTLRSERWHGH